MGEQIVFDQLRQPAYLLSLRFRGRFNKHQRACFSSGSLPSSFSCRASLARTSSMALFSFVMFLYRNILQRQKPDCAAEMLSLRLIVSSSKLTLDGVEEFSDRTAQWPSEVERYAANGVT